MLNLLVILSFSLSSVKAYELSEKKLLELVKETSIPALDEITLGSLEAQLGESKLKEKFQAELYAKGSYAETNEQPIIQFQPIFTPVKQFQMGVKKNHTYGISSDLFVGTDQRSASSPFAGRFQNVTTTGVSLQVSIDLWKDLFGSTSRAELRGLNLAQKRAKIMSEVQENVFTLNIRRIYWSLIANEEQRKISENLLKNAKEQVSDALKRKRSAVADEADVARYQAQLAQREGTLLYLDYQKQNLLKELQKNIPILASKEIVLPKENFDQIVNQVLACTLVISQKKETPYDFTTYDEMIDLLRQIKTANSKANKRYDDMDVKLYALGRSTGVASNQTRPNLYRGSYGSSLDDMQDTNRTGYEIGVNIAIPLGSEKENSQRVIEIINEKKNEAAIISSQTNLDTTHFQLVKSIQLLADVVRAQKRNSLELKKKISVMKRKFSQARVSVNELTQDQDALMNSELTGVETQLQVVNILFDYFAIFNQTPCEFNRI